MRTPVILVAGQDHTDEVTGALLRRTGTVVVEHRFDGHVVRRMTATLSRGELITTEDALEFAHGCVSCTIRDDLLVLLRRLHRRDNVGRIVVHLAPWLEPQPICWAIDHVRVCVGHGYPDGPAALDALVEGRSMWAGVRDAVTILVGGNVGEVLFTVIGTAFGAGRAPVGTRQLLLVNLLTEHVSRACGGRHLAVCRTRRRRIPNR